jgi:hypothetical protein
MLAGIIRVLMRKSMKTIMKITRMRKTLFSRMKKRKKKMMRKKME